MNQNSINLEEQKYEHIEKQKPNSPEKAKSQSSQEIQEQIVEPESPVANSQ